MLNMGCEKLKKWMVFLALLLPAAVIANPVFFPPVDLFMYIIVLGIALGIESAIVTFILLFCYMEPLLSFIALFLGNMVIYLVIFRPVLGILENVLIAEIIIVVVDGIFIKLISSIDRLQKAEFQGLKWRTAFIASIAGNIVSYCLGVLINKFTW